MSKQQEDLQPVGEFTEKSERAMTQKALEYTVEINPVVQHHGLRSYHSSVWKRSESCSGNLRAETNGRRRRGARPWS